jgi:hypothetical protein
VTQDPFLELAPLAALEALDGEDRERFAAHEKDCQACQREVAEFRKVVEKLPLATEPVRPASRLHPRASARPVDHGSRSVLWAVAAMLLLSLGLLTSTWLDHRSTLRELALQKDLAASAQDEARKASEQTAALEERFRRDGALASLARLPGSRMAHLAGGKEAPNAGGCVVWNPARGEAVLMAAALAPAPKDMTYEVWVISDKKPVRAGEFRPEMGNALFTLTPVPQLAQVQAFAVTIEPAPGTDAPSGPMVLSGNVGP